MALAALMEEGREGREQPEGGEGQDDGKRLRCAVLSYGFMLDLDGSTAVADAAAQWGFVNAAAGKDAGDLPSAVPLLVMRASPGFSSRAERGARSIRREGAQRNLPLTLVNHPTGSHSFDLLDDTDASRIVIRQMLAFLRVQLGV